MNEIWKDVVGYEGHYQVSNLGNVRSLNYHRMGIVRELRQTTHRKTRYNKVVLCVEKKRKDYLVHRLVALAFHDNPLGLPDVNHKNGNKADNRADNLEWSTKSNNSKHGYALGLLHDLRGEGNPAAKLTEDDVRSIRSMKGENRYTIAQKFGVNQATIYDVQQNKTWRHVLN